VSALTVEPELEHELGDDRRALTEERRAAIVRLLEALTDGLPMPARAPMSTLGFVHGATARETCEDCLANGFVSRDCETCGGGGFLERRRVRDPYDTGAASGWFGSSSAKHERGRERDAEIARLAAQTAPALPAAEIVATVRPERWEAERRALREDFDVGAVERLLDELALVDVDAYRAVHAVHVYSWLPSSGLAAVCVERALVFLSARLPEVLRSPPPVEVKLAAALTRAERNREIRKLAGEGAVSQWLARRFALSVAQVNRILAGDDREGSA
jgi:hypothetical protein